MDLSPLSIVSFALAIFLSAQCTCSYLKYIKAPGYINRYLMIAVITAIAAGTSVWAGWMMCTYRFNG